jgi:hypothetical protein
MVSFAARKQINIIAEAAQSFALDNGAFTTWKHGKTFNMEAYAAWVEKWHRHPGFDWCVIPDVIEGTIEQNDEMIHKWTTTSPTSAIASVPVWHFHEPPRRLQALAARFKIVALGSSGIWSSPGSKVWWERVAEVMPYVCDETGRPHCKLHGLRMLNPRIFTAMPLASADSTNAVQNAGAEEPFGRYGPRTPWQRANVIADRVEAFNSASRWKPDAKRPSLFKAL